MLTFFVISREIIKDIFRNIKNIISFILIILMIITAFLASIYEKISTDRSITLASLSILSALLLCYYRLKEHVRHNPGSSLRYLLPRFLVARAKGGSRASRWFARTLLWSISAVTIYVAVLLYWGNFGTVIRGQVYRSAQLGSATMSFNVQRYGIRAIINLRGSNPGQDWYDREVADAKALGIHHIDFRMSAKRALSREQAEQLIALMARRRPSHC